MIYKDGKYLQVCGFKLCGNDFYGRLNQVYCSAECKQAHNNRKTSLVSKAAKGSDLKIKKAVRIIMGLFKPDREGKFVINQVQLASLAFPFDLPTLAIKDDRYNGKLHSFGSFCFYQQDGNFIFYKI
jgi:hypothetical protein